MTGDLPRAQDLWAEDLWAAGAAASRPGCGRAQRGSAAGGYPNLTPVVTPQAVRALVEARLSAQRTRAAHLASVAEGVLSVPEVIMAATTPQGVALLRLRLRSLLEAQPGCGRKRAAAVMARLRLLTGEAFDERTVDLRWLLDNRSRGRFVHWLTATGRYPNPPWPGFPFAPAPDRATPGSRGPGALAGTAPSQGG